MKMLLIHADLLEYWTTRPTKLAEKDAQSHQRIEDALVVFVTVEAGDSRKVPQAVQEIRKVMGWVKCGEAFIYPYAHLSENLSSPGEAIEVLNALSSALGCNRAPFGWYKRFHLHAKGHPLAELSRSI